MTKTDITDQYHHKEALKTDSNHYPITLTGITTVPILKIDASNTTEKLDTHNNHLKPDTNTPPTKTYQFLPEHNITITDLTESQFKTILNPILNITPESIEKTQYDITINDEYTHTYEYETYTHTLLTGTLRDDSPILIDISRTIGLTDTIHTLLKTRNGILTDTTLYTPSITHGETTTLYIDTEPEPEPTVTERIWAKITRSRDESLQLKGTILNAESIPKTHEYTKTNTFQWEYSFTENGYKTPVTVNWDESTETSLTITVPTIHNPATFTITDDPYTDDQTQLERFLDLYASGSPEFLEETRIPIQSHSGFLQNNQDQLYSEHGNWTISLQT